MGAHVMQAILKMDIWNDNMEHTFFPHGEQNVTTEILFLVFPATYRS